ncbi:DUF4233 domain-containing protein [Cellulomonas sp. PhB143]|uniref:DUF4233 domain-containing protein n=1 Tax=Cellulomonas sp. PhB143 TaxID=2485186 RepID=UPI001F27D654|nr:DUF4233 domain-containing protein [Cellulomonas sp. PhB143]
MSHPNAAASSVPGPGADGAAPRIRAKKSAKLQFTSTTLVLEAVVVLFATFTVYALRTVPSVWPDAVAPPTGAAIWTVGAVLMVVLVVLSRAVGTGPGYVAGSVVQLPVLATGLVVPLMFVVGVVFAAMWIVSLRLGGRIDRERAAYDAAHPETAPNVS